MEEAGRVLKHFSLESVQCNTVKQIVTVPVPQILGRTGEVIQLVWQERVDCLTEQPVDVVNVIPQERVR